MRPKVDGKPFDRTYEGLKLDLVPEADPTELTPFDRTYEGLKLG